LTVSVQPSSVLSASFQKTTASLNLFLFVRDCYINLPICFFLIDLKLILKPEIKYLELMFKPKLIMKQLFLPPATPIDLNGATTY